MKSWKTTLGGSLGATGTFLWGVTVALSVFKAEIIPDGVAKWCIVGGVMMQAGGVLFTGLFGRDNGVTSEQAGAVKPEQPTSKTNE